MLSSGVMSSDWHDAFAKAVERLQAARRPLEECPVQLGYSDMWEWADLGDACRECHRFPDLLE